MHNKMVSAALASAALLVLVAGCAAQPDDVASDANGNGENGESADGTDPGAPKLDLDGVGTESNGFTCGCPDGQELSGGLCYPRCASGYSGEGPVCWQICASGFYDTGWFCQRDSKIVSANTSKCPWYDKCGVAAKKGCSTCPAGYHNDGCTCRIDAYIYAQPSYGRGAGTALSCSSN